MQIDPEHQPSILPDPLKMMQSADAGMCEAALVPLLPGDIPSVNIDSSAILQRMVAAKPHVVVFLYPKEEDSEERIWLIDHSDPQLSCSAAQEDTDFLWCFHNLANSSGLPVAVAPAAKHDDDILRHFPAADLLANLPDARFVCMAMQDTYPLEAYAAGMLLQQTACKCHLSCELVVIANLSAKKMYHRAGTPQSHIDQSLTHKKILQCLKNSAFSDFMHIACTQWKHISADCRSLLCFLAGSMEGQHVVQPENCTVEWKEDQWVMMDWTNAGPRTDRALWAPLLAWQNKYAQKAIAGEDFYVRLARDSIQQAVMGPPLLDPRDPAHLQCIDRPEARFQWPREVLEQQAGVFLSIFTLGELRGCVGSLAPTTPCVGDEIVQNARAAALEDPRFPSLQRIELPDVRIRVDILGEMEEIEDLALLDPNAYGIVLQDADRQGILLPRQPGIDTVEKQIVQARINGGFPEDVPLKDLDIFRFRTECHETPGNVFAVSPEQQADYPFEPMSTHVFDD